MKYKVIAGLRVWTTTVDSKQVEAWKDADCWRVVVLDNEVQSFEVNKFNLVDAIDLAVRLAE